jgi:hypothetical protein
MTQCIHDADEGIAWCKGYLGRNRGLAVAGLDIGQADGRGKDFDACLPGGRWAQLILDDLEDLWAASLGDDDTSIAHVFGS